MSITTWVDARLVAFAPVLAKALIAQSGPLVTAENLKLTEIEIKLSHDLQAALGGAVAQAMTNLPAEIAQAIKGLLPFPFEPEPPKPKHFWE